MTVPTWKHLQSERVGNLVYTEGFSRLNGKERVGQVNRTIQSIVPWLHYKSPYRDIRSKEVFLSLVLLIISRVRSDIYMGQQVRFTYCLIKTRRKNYPYLRKLFNY